MVVTGKLKPLANKVLVTDMNFGEQTTSSGIVLTSDDGVDRGIHPRWARVHAVGPDHAEEYNVGDWILVEHGRWSRGIKCENNNETFTVRLIDVNCVMLWSKDRPADIEIGTL